MTEVHTGSTEEQAVAYPLLLLRFFRDVSPEGRRNILADVGVVPAGYRGELTQAVERLAFDRAVGDGKSDDIAAAMRRLFAAA